jgi:hypothetical protein
MIKSSDYLYYWVICWAWIWYFLIKHHAHNRPTSDPFGPRSEVPDQVVWLQISSPLNNFPMSTFPHLDLMFSHLTQFPQWPCMWPIWSTVRRSEPRTGTWFLNQVQSLSPLWALRNIWIRCLHVQGYSHKGPTGDRLGPRSAGPGQRLDLKFWPKSSSS